RELLEAIENAKRTKGTPTAILARTLKGKGLSFIEDKNGWHGKALKKDEAEKAIAELEKQFVKTNAPKPMPSKPSGKAKQYGPYKHISTPQYEFGKEVASSDAVGHTFADIGKTNESVVCTDGHLE